MPSFLEIPPEYRVASAKVGFVSWLAAMPIPGPAKARIAALWKANTGGSLDAIDYAAIMAKSPQGQGATRG